MNALHSNCCPSLSSVSLRARRPLVIRLATIICSASTALAAAAPATHLSGPELGDWEPRIASQAEIPGELPGAAGWRQQPSDQDVRRIVLERLARAAAVPAERVRVQVRNGVVRLTGVVDDLLARDKAAEIAQRTRGVQRVENQIRVEPVARPDSVLGHDVRAALREDSAAETGDVAVAVADAVVTLYGRVGSWYERGSAADAAKAVRGVRGVRNYIRVVFDQPRSSSEIEEDIQARLAADPRLAGRTIHVTVRDGTAVLRGRVQNALERVWADSDARVNGITEVDPSGLRVVAALPARFAQPTYGGDPRRHGPAPATTQGPWNRLVEPRYFQNTMTTLTDGEVENAIEEELFSNPLIDASDVTVRVRNGLAVLSGTVANEAERLAATDSARRGGATQVQNELRLEE